MGGKAATLADLKHRGWPVPAGIIVTTQAQMNVQQHPQSTTFWASVIAAAKKIPAQSYAVRSSATVEDGQEQSFAGLLHTSLGVQLSELPAAIEHCWASAQAARVQQYAPGKIMIAVVIQPMIPADVAGVLFSRHPVDQTTTDMYVEWVAGLGETLVQGTVTPNYGLIDDQGKLHQVTIGQQSHGLFLSAHGNLERRENVTAGLIENVSHQLFSLAKQLEPTYNTGIDMEWAISQGKLWVLQVRPITT